MIIDEKKVQFAPGGGFHTALKERVFSFLDESSKPSTGDWRLFLKTGLILVYFVAAYSLLVFVPTSPLIALLNIFALALGFFLIGCNIMHDGAHGGYSSNKTINKIMGFTLDLMGGSQMLWRPKHNILHHTYTNLDKLDTDLETHGLLRLSPSQTRRGFHRYQHWYAFFLYAFMSLSWVFYSDFAKFSSGYIGKYKLPQFSKRDVVLFFLTKVLYLGYMIVLPSFFHPIAHVLLGFVLIHMIFSCGLALTFQLAHTVEGTTFPEPEFNTGNLEQEWAIHQVETTVNFAPKSKWAAWAFGGLNFQIEHHIFPRLSHIHYPAISKIVEATCREFNIAYTSYPTVRAAILAHLRFLKTMGNQPAEAPPNQ